MRYQGKQYETMELVFQGPAPQGSQVEIDLTGHFCLNDSEVTVKGFYAGDGIYKLRFLPELAGCWTVEINSVSLGLQKYAEVEVAPPDLGRHGPVRPKGTAMYYADGTWCPTFGTTIYALPNQSDALIEETLKSLKESPFNKLRTCVFPKHYAYNANNPRFYPFERSEGFTERAFSAEGLPINPVRHGQPDGYWDTARPCFAYWERLEQLLRRLDIMGIEVDLILFHPYDRWGFENMSREDNLRYLDYLLRRLAAFPHIWWSMANEYDLCFDKTAEDFEQFARFLSENDPFRHPLSNHNCFRMWDANSGEITHVSWQTKELTRVAEMLRRYQKPVLIDECRYEGNVPEFWGNLSGETMTRSFWRVMAQGGYCTHGETFLPGTEMGDKATDTGEKDVVWWARGGKLNGQSPVRIAFLREVIENLPGPLEPMSGSLNELLCELPEEAVHGVIAGMPPDFQDFLHSITAMDRPDRARFYAVEYTFQGHCGELAYLTYLDDQCAAAFELALPENRSYCIDVLDTWNMERNTVLRSVNGHVRVELPGKPWIAVLAVAEE